MTQTNPLTLGRRMRPTLKHRPAVWECMLGTVMARSPEGEVKFFDFRWDDAVAFAGGIEDADPRTWKAASGSHDIRKGQYVLYVLK